MGALVVDVDSGSGAAAAAALRLMGAAEKDRSNGADLWSSGLASADARDIQLLQIMVSVRVMLTL